MCLIAFAWRHHPRFPLVVAANRDEFHERPTAPAAFWPESPRILAGRDLLGGGTWLGVSAGGRFAALTNLRSEGAAPRDAPSRGALVSAFLRGEQRPADYLAEVAHRAHRYQGFCLIAADRTEVGCFCARDAAPALLDPGVYGLGNARLGAPWPRVERIREGFAAILARPRWRSADLMALLGDRTSLSGEELPDAAVGLERERRCSPAFIVDERYGTRSSTVLLMDAGGHVDFTEQSFDPRGRPGVRARFAFRSDAPVPLRPLS